MKRNYRNSQNVPIEIHPYNKLGGGGGTPTILKKRDSSLQIAFAQLGNEGSNCYWEFWDQLFQPILSLKP